MSDPTDLLAGSAFSNGHAQALPARGREEAPASHGHSGVRAFGLVLAVIVVGGLLLWAFTGIVSLAFHIAEYVAVAIVAGWLGYKAGHARGRRGH